MESYSSYNYSSSSSSSSSSASCPVYIQEEVKRSKPLPSFQSSLHAVRRVPKPMTKKPIAPMPPTPPKIYKVEPLNFKETVQMLTTAPGFQPPSAAVANNFRRLQDVAPPPLDLIKQKSDKSSEKVVANDITETTEKMRPRTPSSNVCGGFSSPLGFPPLSPSSLSWWASILPSPGTLSSL